MRAPYVYISISAIPSNFKFKVYSCVAEDIPRIIPLFLLSLADPSLHALKFLCLFVHNLIQRQENTRLTVNTQMAAAFHSKKLFIQRDYNEGTAVRYSREFPIELRGKVRNLLVMVGIKYNSMYL